MKPIAKLTVVIIALGIAGDVRAAGPSGSVAGTVRLSGKAPANPPVALAADCVKLAGHRLLQDEVVVGPDGGLANVFVQLQGEGLTGAAGPVPTDVVVIEQKGCAYRPRMTGARAGQTLRIVNADAALHNVHSVSAAGLDFNVAQPAAGMKFDFKLAAEQKMLRLSCDVHPWMRAFVGVVGHPWFAVTGEDGRFKLAGVPPGRYDLVLWHERFGTLRKPVSIAAGGVAAGDFEYGAGSQP